jgi:hypothetical protein
VEFQLYNPSTDKSHAPNRRIAHYVKDEEPGHNYHLWGLSQKGTLVVDTVPTQSHLYEAARKMAEDFGILEIFVAAKGDQPILVYDVMQLRNGEGSTITKLQSRTIGTERPVNALR